MKRLFFKLLARIGLTTIERQRFAEKRAADADEYARLVTLEAERSGDMIVAGNFTTIRDIRFAAGRRLIVAPGVDCAYLSNLYFDGEKS